MSDVVRIWEHGGNVGYQNTMCKRHRQNLSLIVCIYPISTRRLQYIELRHSTFRKTTEIRSQGYPSDQCLINIVTLHLKRLTKYHLCIR